jgi:hypothetical protein
VVYHLLVAAADERERTGLDATLGVAGWPGPGQPARTASAVEPGAPPWWHGDEDASQSFLAAMGVRLE